MNRLAPEFLPEAILRQDAANEAGWRVERASGMTNSCTDFSSKLIRVPEIDTDSQVLTRLHEGLHLRYSESERKPLSSPSAHLFRQMLEEIRVDALGRDKHALDMTSRFDDYDLGKNSPLWISPTSERAKLKAALYYLQTFGQRQSRNVKPLHEHLDGLFTSKEQMQLRHCAVMADSAYSDLPNFDSYANEWAETLTKIFDPPMPVEQPEVKQKKKVESEEEKIAKSIRGDKPDPSMPPTKEGMPQFKTFGGTERRDTYTFCRHITRANPGKTLRLPMGAKETGSEPKHWHRYCEDKAVFSNRRLGGTLLIDGSGSMSWNYDLLRKAMREFPAATVAIYEGLERGDSKGKLGNGVLCVVAEQGRWDDPDKRHCDKRSQCQGGNDIDLESLQWLAAQRGPRVWLSDAQVCGGAYSGARGPSLHEMCFAVAKQGKIARTMSIKETIAYFRRAGNHRSSNLLMPRDFKEYMSGDSYRDGPKV